MKTLRLLLAAPVAAFVLAVSAPAAEATPAGTWKWTQPGRGGAAGVERTLQLELKDGALGGTLLGWQAGEMRIPDTPISAASFKDGAIAFNVELTFGDNKFVVKYAGKLEGDTIKGQIERPGFNGGEATKTDWLAKRGN